MVEVCWVRGSYFTEEGMKAQGMKPLVQVIATYRSGNGTWGLSQALFSFVPCFSIVLWYWGWNPAYARTHSTLSYTPQPFPKPPIKKKNTVFM